jgi:hypothetical protein
VGGTQFIIGFEGSQALPVCPSGKCKHLTGAIEVFWRWGGRGLRAALGRKMLKLPSGGLHVKHAEQSNVEFGYQLSICSGTMEIHGKP